MKQFSWRRFVVPLVVALVALAAPRIAEAQTGKLSGVVTDASTGQPIEGAQVRVQGTQLGAMTHANGRYFIISVPPGTYTVEARRIGYQAQERVGVQVVIDVTREANFALNSAAATLQAQRIVAEPTPLVEAGVTGSAQAIPAEVIQALPVTNVAGVLALQQGFFQVPQNTDIVSFSDSRRNAVSPIRIRGGRAGETLTLIDGIPINNIVFGGPALDLTTAAVQQLDYQKGGFEPQYGNALSGIINIATREGGVRPEGNVEYQTAGFGSRLGLEGDEALGFDLLRGYLAGPVPGTSNRVRFVVAGQTQQGRDRALKFDDDTYDFDNPPVGTTGPQVLDLFPGWRGIGYDAERSLFGKLTILPTVNTKINLTALDYGRQRQSYDYDFLLSGFDPLTAPGVDSRSDPLGLVVGGWTTFQDVVQGSIDVERRLLAASLEQRFDRTNLQVRYGRFTQGRTTCNYFQGVCLGSRFDDTNYLENFVQPGVPTPEYPIQITTGTDVFYGGEEVTSDIFRADVQSQVSDHHNLQTGIFFQRHDLLFRESRNEGADAPRLVNQKYGSKPYDAAAYVQDKIEYDFLTVKLGFRFDYGKAVGTAFADPQDPTNSTTAREVCNGELPQFGATTPYTTVDTLGQTLSGIAACSYDGTLMDSAAAIAQRDDFVKAKVRKAFSPRVGVSFPLSERSSVFFNAGKYTQNPTYNNLYQATGIGTRAGVVAQGGDGVCLADEARPGSTECIPGIKSAAFSLTAPYIGNPNLLLEQTIAYEVGYATQLGTKYAINVLLFNKDQTGLSGVKRSENIVDIGTTYAGLNTPRYSVIVNQDFATSRGIEMQLRRRITNYWGFDINYSFSKATTNSPPPDKAVQNVSEGDSIVLREIRSEIDQPHVFNAALLLRVDERTPEFRFGNLLRNSYGTITARAASGIPYTPFSGVSRTTRDRPFDEPNAARGPTTFQVDLLAGKDFNLANVRYGAFFRVVNLLDRKNCVQVFVSTGTCTSGAVDPRRNRQGNQADLSLVNSTYFDHPEYIGSRRSILAGARVNF